MGVGLRPLRSADIPQSVEVERDAFPTHFPPTSFLSELRNQRARYLVALRRDDSQAEEDPSAGAADRAVTWLPAGNFIRNARSFLSGRQALIVGLLGAWHIADEAHIVSIGVKRDYRGKGIGELLLIGAIEQATAQGATKIVLEVRVSNRVARNLYRKYGFSEVTVRKSYYHDNKEDAVVMIADQISAPHFIQRFRNLEREHRRRWGRSERVLA